MVAAARTLRYGRADVLLNRAGRSFGEHDRLASSETPRTERRKDVLSEWPTGPPTYPSATLRCSGGLTLAKALRASKAASRKMKFPTPWYSCEPGLSTTSLQP